MPKVLKVIESQVNRGQGVEGSIFRLVTQYHTLNGKFLAEVDPYPNQPLERKDEETRKNS